MSMGPLSFIHNDSHLLNLVGSLRDRICDWILLASVPHIARALKHLSFINKNFPTACITKALGI